MGKKKVLFLEKIVFRQILFLTGLSLFFLRVSVCALTYDVGVNLPEKMIDLKSGEITKKDLLQKPKLVIVANRKAFEIIKEAEEVITYPSNTVWIPNLSGAPSWVVRAFIKPSLIKTAKKISPRILFDPEGEVAKNLKVSEKNNDYLAVFYVDNLGIKKVMEKFIVKKKYKSNFQKQNLIKEIISAWSEVLVE